MFGRPPAASRRPLYLSIQIDARSARGVRAVANADGTIELLNDVEHAVAADGDAPEALTAVLRDLGVRARRWNPVTAITTVRSDVAIVRRVRMSSLTGARQKKAAGYLAADSARFNAWKISDCDVKAKLDPNRPAEFAVSKTLRAPLRARVQLLRRAGLEAKVEPVSLALARALPDADAVLEIGDDAATLCVYSRFARTDGGESTVVRDDVALVERFIVGVDAFARGVHRAGVATTVEQAHRVVLTEGLAASAVAYAVDDFAIELESRLIDLRDRENASVSRLVLTGRGARIPGLAEALAARLDVPVEPATLPQLRSASFPPEVLEARAPELAALVGAALAATDTTALRRMNLGGPDRDSVFTALVSVDAQRLRQLALAPVLAAVVVGGAQIYESVRISDVQAREARARHLAHVLAARAGAVHALQANVEQLLTVQNELRAIRSSAEQRANELWAIGRRIPGSARIDATTSTADGWTIVGKATSHAAIGREVADLRRAFKGLVVKVIPGASTRQSGSPSSLVTYTVHVARPAGITTAQLPSPSAPAAPAALAVLVLATSTIRRRIPWDRRLLVLASLSIGGLGYFYVVTQGEAIYSEHATSVLTFEAAARNAQEAIQYRAALEAARKQLVVSIRNLTPASDESALLAATYQNFDEIANKFAHLDAHQRRGVVLQQLDPASPALLSAGVRDRRDVALAFQAGRIGPDGQVATPAPTATPSASADQRSAPTIPTSVRPFLTGGVSDAYATVVPITVVFEGPYRDLLAALGTISKSRVLTNVNSASLRTLKPDRDNPLMSLTLSAAVYLPLAIDRNGQLVRPRAATAAGAQQRAATGPATSAPDAAATGASP